VSDYVQDALDADAAFREDGQLITLSLKQPGVYAGGAVVPGTPIIQRVWGIETAVTIRDLGVGVVNGTLIKSGDRKLLISALADDGTPLIVPKVDDLATAAGQLYSVKNIDVLNPGGIPVMYTLVVRV